jgi:hypothetical protein
MVEGHLKMIEFDREREEEEEKEGGEEEE